MADNGYWYDPTEESYVRDVNNPPEENPYLNAPGGFEEVAKKGWYTSSFANPGGSPWGNIYTGVPQTTQERDLIYNFYTSYGRLPTAEESQKMMRETYGPSSMGQNLAYMPGSTPWELGLRSSKENYDWQTNTITNQYGQRPGTAGEYGYGPFAERKLKAFAPPKQITEQGYAQAGGFAEAYTKTINDYLSKAVADKSLDSFQADTIRANALAMLTKGGSVMQLPGVGADLVTGTTYATPAEAEAARWGSFTGHGQGVTEMPSDFLNQLGNYLTIGYQNYLQSPEYQKQYEQAYQGAATAWHGQNVAGGASAQYPVAPQIPPLQEKASLYQMPYRDWVEKMPNLSERDKVWLYSNYEGLVNAWMTYGQEEDFMRWVKGYLAGNYPPKAKTPTPTDIRRFTPYTRVG